MRKITDWEAANLFECPKCYSTTTDPQKHILRAHPEDGPHRKELRIIAALNDVHREIVNRPTYGPSEIINHVKNDASNSHNFLDVRDGMEYGIRHGILKPVNSESFRLVSLLEGYPIPLYEPSQRSKYLADTLYRYLHDQDYGSSDLIPAMHHVYLTTNESYLRDAHAPDSTSRRAPSYSDIVLGLDYGVTNKLFNVSLEHGTVTLAFLDPTLLKTQDTPSDA